MSIPFDLAWGSDNSAGVQPLILPQDTSEAASQAVQEQKPGSEQSPPENPDVRRLLKRVNELDKRATAICDRLWMAKPGPNYEEREELDEELRAADRERAAIRAELSSFYEASSNDKDKALPDHYKPETPTLIGAD